VEMWLLCKRWAAFIAAKFMYHLVPSSAFSHPSAGCYRSRDIDIYFSCAPIKRSYASLHVHRKFPPRFYVILYYIWVMCIYTKLEGIASPPHNSSQIVRTIIYTSFLIRGCSKIFPFPY